MQNRIDLNDERVLRDLALLMYDAYMAAYAAYYNIDLEESGTWPPLEELESGQQYAWIEALKAHEHAMSFLTGDKTNDD